MTQPLMAEAHSEDGDRQFGEGTGTDPEVAFAVRAAGTGGDDDVVEVEGADPVPGGVVGDHDRGCAVDTGKEAVEVVGERVVVVHEQCADRRGGRVEV